MKQARALMFQGTGSDVGKSVLCAGVIRALVKRGHRVLPFKPQNMSNNAAVTADGGEIGRAQALQAVAARVPPSLHMNPVLLKPESPTGAQLIVRGERRARLQARDFLRDRLAYLPDIMDSFRELCRELGILLCYEVTRDLPLEWAEIETPMTRMKAPKKATGDLTRAGSGCRPDRPRSRRRGAFRPCPRPLR